ncbi:hypothetical protein [Amycolatopsis sp. YIM 10]|uniref:hypothetical protein n=1 Tax=Amycolatopsis sp. YIM 10 TaxID=2653857 RepID=UPI00128FF977|nr:hypothetical protein [Amycolatopsis sp. YIM 10]QFU87914.1 hypothetical protein YIM_13640 [Amycolatopsis sp. YIM 10]
MSFDFFTGEWLVANRRLTSPLTGSTTWTEFDGHTRAWQLFGGAANLDEITMPDQGWTGLSLRLLDPATGDWSIYWVNSRDGKLAPPVTGRFVNGRGEFHGEDEHDGKPVQVRFIWTGVTTGTPRWEQAFSADGAVWETNWIMDFRRP